MYRGLILRECGIRYSIQHCTRLLYLLYRWWPSNSKLKYSLAKSRVCGRSPLWPFLGFQYHRDLVLFSSFGFFKSEKTRDVMNLTLLMLAHAPWLFSLALK